MMRKAVLFLGLIISPLITFAQNTTDCGTTDGTDSAQLCFAEKLFPNCKPAKIQFVGQGDPYSMIIKGIQNDQCFIAMEIKNPNTNKFSTLTCPHELKSLAISEETERQMDKVSRVELSVLPYALALENPQKAKEMGCFGDFLDISDKQFNPEKLNPLPKTQKLPKTGNTSLFLKFFGWVKNLFF